MAEPTADLDSTCAGCGNPLRSRATCEAGCSDRGTPAAEESRALSAPGA